MPETAPLRPRFASTQVDAIVAEMDTGEHDFPAAAANQAVNFSEDIVGRPAAQRGPDVGNNAVRTIQQTTVLHFDEGTLMAVEARDALRKLRHAELTQFLPKPILVGHHLDH